MYTYHVTVPAGVTELTVKMDFITAGNGGRVYGGWVDEPEPGGAELEHDRAVSV